VSGATVEYNSEYFTNTANINEAKNRTDFSYLWEDWGGDSFSSDPLRDYINEPASVTVSGGKVTIKLGTPKFDLHNDSSWLIEEGISVSPNNAKVYLDMKSGNFATFDGKYGLFCIKDRNNVAVLCYADIDVTIQGTSSYSDSAHTFIYNVSLKKGWNYVIGSKSGNTQTYTSSVSQPSGYKWTVTDWH